MFDDSRLAGLISGSVSTNITEAPRSKKQRENLFGCAERAACYRQAKDLIVEHKIFRMARLETFPSGTRRLTICNTWRIERDADESIVLSEFDFRLKEWREATDLRWWPIVPLFPVHTTRSLAWWRDVAKRAIWKTLLASGYEEIRAKENDGLQQYAGGGGLAPKKMRARTMAEILFRHYFGVRTDRKHKGEEVWKGGFLKAPSMRAGARVLRAQIFDHVFEKELLSAACAIHWSKLELTEYLSLAQHREAVLRVAREHRNMLPILPFVAPAYWSRQDLLSRKLWVKDGRQSTLVQTKRFSKIGYAKTFLPFDTAASWRWLCAAPMTVVRAWADSSRMSRAGVTNAVANLAACGIRGKIPAIAYVQVLREEWRFTAARLRREHHAYVQVLREEWRLYDRYAGGGDDQQKQRLYRLFCTHIATVWAQAGFNMARAEVRGAAYSDVVDYLVNQGFGDGFPDKNSTWAALVRRSEDWHRHQAETRRGHPRRTYQWTSEIGAISVSRVTFTPLISSGDLAEEGRAMHHCVEGYDQYCAQGDYRVFSVSEETGARSTLGLRVNPDAKKPYTIEQHRGPCNGAVSKSAAAAAKALVSLLNDVHAAARSGLQTPA